MRRKATRKKKSGREIKQRLAFRIWNSSEVFIAEEKYAEYLHRIYRALHISQSWGDFKTNMPRDEYSRLIKWIFEDNPYPRPKMTAPFSPQQIPGWEEGDYPPWSKQLVEKSIPIDLLHKYAKRESGMVSGSWWTIEAANWPALKSELESRAFTLTERNDLAYFR